MHNKRYRKSITLGQIIMRIALYFRGVYAQERCKNTLMEEKKNSQWVGCWVLFGTLSTWLCFNASKPDDSSQWIPWVEYLTFPTNLCLPYLVFAILPSSAVQAERRRRTTKKHWNGWQSTHSAESETSVRFLLLETPSRNDIIIYLLHDSFLTKATARSR